MATEDASVVVTVLRNDKGKNKNVPWESSWGQVPVDVPSRPEREWNAAQVTSVAQHLREAIADAKFDTGNFRWRLDRSLVKDQWWLRVEGPASAANHLLVLTDEQVETLPTTEWKELP